MENKRILELNSLLKSLWDGLHTNAIKMSRMTVRSGSDDAAIEKRFTSLQQEQFALARKICDAEDELADLGGGGVILRPPLQRFARSQSEWVRLVGRAQ